MSFIGIKWFEKLIENSIMKYSNNLNNVSFGHLKSEKAVDRHLFLNSNIDDSVLQILATLQQRDDFRRMSISRLINLLILKGVNDLKEMESDDAFETISMLDECFLEL